MPEFAQLGGEHPVLATIPVASKAEGTEVMSKLFGQVSQVAMKEAIDVSKDHSTQQLINASTQTQNIINDTRHQIIKDPANAANYAELSQKLLQNVSNVPLNKSDRQKLDYYINNAKSTIDDHAFKTEFDQDQRIHQAAYYENMQSNLQSISHAIGVGDFAQAESLMQNFKEADKKALQTGIITPSVYANQEKLIQEYITRSQLMHDAFGQTNVVQHNEHLNTPLVPTTDLQTRPIDPGTQHIFNNYQHLRTTDDLNNAITSGSHNPDVIQHLFNLPEQQFRDKYALWSGANNINAMLQSNHNFEELNQLKKDLERSTEPLSTYQKGQLGKLNLLFNNLSNGEYINAINSTGEGARLTDNLNKQLAAIQNGIYYELTPEGVEQKKSELTNQAMNQYYSNMHDLGVSMHIPPQYINSLPQQIIDHANQAFDQGGNPNNLINNINGLSPQNRVQLAKAQKTPEQKEIAYAIGIGSDNAMLPSFKDNVIKALQPNSYDSKLLHQSSKNNTDDASLNAYFLSELGRTGNAISAQPDGADRIAALSKAAINYAKYQGYTHQDYELKNRKDYINEFVQQLNTAYDIKSNPSILYNQRQVFNYTENDMSTLANYMISLGEQKIKEKGRDVDVFNAKGALHVVITPENMAVVLDQNNNVYYSNPLNDHLIALAHQESKKIETESDRREKQILLTRLSGTPLGVF